MRATRRRVRDGQLWLDGGRTQERFDLSMPHSDETWRWLLEREGTHQWVATRRHEFVGRIVEVGQADTAFLEWIAERDMRRRKRK